MGCTGDPKFLFPAPILALELPPISPLDWPFISIVLELWHWHACAILKWRCQVAFLGFCAPLLFPWHLKLSTSIPELLITNTTLPSADLLPSLSFPNKWHNGAPSERSGNVLDSSLSLLVNAFCGLWSILFSTSCLNSSWDGNGMKLGMRCLTSFYLDLEVRTAPSQYLWPCLHTNTSHRAPSNAPGLPLST